jgi:hypothetical protein
VPGCSCETLSEIFFLDEAPEGWRARLRAKASGNWKDLYRCAACGRAFSVDVSDKYHHQVVVQVDDLERWEEKADSTDLRKALLLQRRGGTDGPAAGTS